MPEIPNTTKPGLSLTSIGNGTNASRWSPSPAPNAWNFVGTAAPIVGTTYNHTFATQTISGFTKYFITVVIGGPNNNGTTANTGTQMFLRLHDSTTGTDVFNDVLLGTLWFTSTIAYSPGAYTWSGIYTADSTALRTITSFVRVSFGGCITEQINGTIIGLS